MGPSAQHCDYWCSGPGAASIASITSVGGAAADIAASDNADTAASDNAAYVDAASAGLDHS